MGHVDSGGRSIVRSAFAAGLLLLAGCGGGGDGPGLTGSGAPADNVSLTLPSRSVALSIGPQDPVASTTFTMSVSAVPEGGLTALFDSDDPAISDIFIERTDGTTAFVKVVYRSPTEIPDGVYDSPITVRVCYDEACQRQVTGSPAVVQSRYTVRSLDTVTADLRAIEVQTVVNRFVAAQQRLVLTLSGPVAASALTVRPNIDLAAVGLTASPQVTLLDNNRISLDFLFNGGQQIVGNRETQARIEICYDPGCNKLLGGAPLDLRVRHSVMLLGTLPPTDGTPSLAVAARAALPHDVIDVEYSAALDALVFVTQWPSQALVVHDLTTGSTRSMPLLRAPLAVSVSPDGRQAAVGHDALVSIVDLDRVGVVGATPRTLNLSAQAADIVHDGAGHVLVTPVGGQAALHLVDIASGTETVTAQFFGWPRGGKIRLQPGGRHVYLANREVSPDDIEHVLIDGSTARHLGDSPYHGDYAMCGNLWFNTTGSIIYTACGNTFRTAADRAQDMTYAGRFDLPSASFGTTRIASLSHREAIQELLFLDDDHFACNPPDNLLGNPCMSFLNRVGSDSLQRRSRHWLPPIDIDGVSHVQRGRHVFHRANGKAVIVSQLLDPTDRAREFYLSELD